MSQHARARHAEGKGERRGEGKGEKEEEREHNTRGKRGRGKKENPVMIIQHTSNMAVYLCWRSIRIRTSKVKKKVEFCILEYIHSDWFINFSYSYWNWNSGYMRFGLMTIKHLFVDLQSLLVLAYSSDLIETYKKFCMWV